MPHELSERQMENRKSTCEILLQDHVRKSVLHRFVSGDEKWIYFQNPKRQKSWVNPGLPSTSTVKPDRFGKKTMLCVWWDQKGVVYHELLKNDQFEPCIDRETTRSCLAVSPGQGNFAS